MKDPLPSLPPDFVGREPEATLLDDLVFVDRRSPIVIHGPGGIGKTSLARYFVRRRYKDANVRWIPLYDSRDALAKLRKRLRQLNQPLDAEIPNIVVIDGAELVEDEALNDVLAAADQTASGKPVLITTRARGSVRGAYYLELGGLGATETEFLLSERAKAPLPHDAARRLAELVGNHPLAAQVAGALLRTVPIERLIADLDGTLYELRSPSGVPQDQLIEVARPKIVDATDLLVEQLRKRPGDLYTISPRQFEELLAAILQDMGWRAELTPPSRDGGRDVLAYLDTDIGRLLCLVEAKRYRKDRPVGVEIVRSLYGTFCDSGANSALLVTTSTFTDGAHAFQRRHPFQLTLGDYSKVVGWIEAYGSGSLSDLTTSCGRCGARPAADPGR